ncbi:pyruvate:ferredoxin (flavodoxin) oxidoreductase [Marinobacteraceae bacterium S3BR75-40.1]
MASFLTIDGNEAAARVAHQTNEVIAIYPITPASPMGEHADAWSARGQTNLWGHVPRIVEMQSEGGAAGAIHGALQTGALTTTFTASQGLLLMLPNMFKIAGELTPTVFHVATRAVASQALSIFCDHSDIMAARSTGFGMLGANSVQEVMDMALIAQAATLKGRVPLVHFFDGFRTSHEIARVEALPEDVIAAMLDDEAIAAHRRRGLSPEHPVVRGTSQNPDVFFQARETVNPWYRDFPAVVQSAMDCFHQLTGRRYDLFEYVGHPEAERVILAMGSACETLEEVAEHLAGHGEKVGVLKVRLFRPWSAQAFLEELPDTVNAIAVLDRTKEPGAEGEPLYKDVSTTLLEAFSEGHLAQLPRVIGGRFGLGSKEFTPGMVKALFDELQKPAPRNHFTLGIEDDVTGSSLAWDSSFRTDANSATFQAVFYGLGSDGTVSANKNSIKIIGEQTDQHAQGYFVYDSKKSGAMTVSHLRFGPQPIRSAYLIGAGEADFVGCHQTVFLEKYDVLEKAADEAVFLLNSPAPADQVWATLPRRIQQQIIDRRLRFYVIDAYAIAENAGMGRRVNTILQTCFFAISGVLPREEAIDQIKQAVEKTYGRKGRHIVRTNFRAIDQTLAALQEVTVPDAVTDTPVETWTLDPQAPDFVREVTARMIAGHGDLIPVSQLPADGTYPSGTAAFEKRNLALEIPVWDTDLCTHCGKCAFVCPHGVIRSKAFDATLAKNAPPTFKHVQIKGKDYPEGVHISYQVAPEDCTGCGLCVDICPIRDKAQSNHKALNMAAQPPLRAQEKANWDFFLGLPDWDRREAKVTTMKGSMLLEPLFEFSGACSGCGETPYIKLASQLFGDRMLVANATGCSSIYGGNLPTTPWAHNAEGRGPAWNNSLFEDNAEFGLGMKVASDQQKQQALDLLQALEGKLDPELVAALRTADESDEPGIHEQRERVARLKEALGSIDSPLARRLETLADSLCKRSVWIIGGDGWAYDIGYGGLDHVLASGMDVNILVLDTEVYSNTGGQTSKATPRGAVAKFSAAGKPTAKKDLARIAMAYENVFVAHVAYGAKDVQTLHAFLEAEAYPGPSLIIAFSPCIAHGVDLANNHRQQDLAVNSGHWPLFRYDPRKAREGANPLHLDSKPPSIPYGDYMKTETRFNMLWRSHPERAQQLLDAAQKEVNERFDRYRQMAGLDWEEDLKWVGEPIDPDSAEEQSND